MSDFSVPIFEQEAQRTPPKLQQLLDQMPDVDKVKLLQIAHHYKLDLDDPAFLPLLLTSQGIDALNQAKERLSGAAKLAAESAVDAQKNVLQQAAIDAEIALKNSVADWSYDTFQKAVDAAIRETLPRSTEVAIKVAVTSINDINQATADCIRKMNNVFEHAGNAYRHQNALTFGIVFIFGVLVGGLGGHYIALKTINVASKSPASIQQSIQKTSNK